MAFSDELKFESIECADQPDEVHENPYQTTDSQYYIHSDTANTHLLAKWATNFRYKLTEYSGVLSSLIASERVSFTTESSGVILLGEVYGVQEDAVSRFESKF